MTNHRPKLWVTITSHKPVARHCRKKQWQLRTQWCTLMHIRFINVAYHWSTIMMYHQFGAKAIQEQKWLFIWWTFGKWMNEIPVNIRPLLSTKCISRCCMHKFDHLVQETSFNCFAACAYVYKLSVNSVCINVRRINISRSCESFVYSFIWWFTSYLFLSNTN